MVRTLQEQAAPATAVRPKILIVDADPDTRALYRAMFPPEDYSVDEADDGAEALGRALASCPDLVLMETQIPRINGYELCRLLRADLTTRLVGILVITTAAKPSDRVRAVTAGADAMIVKPCPLEEVVAAAHEVLDRRRTDEGVTSGHAKHPEPLRAVSSFAERPTRWRSRTFPRGKSRTPPIQPPQVRCPSCDALLVYQHSFVGGVSERSPEQWDYFACRRCGPFQYRHRTRVLKSAT